MMKLTELAERVERLTGPCRETDLAIMQAISGHPWRWADSRTFEPQTVITWDQYGESAPGNPFYTLEEFTASLDAAMTLVPANHRWWVEGEQIDSAGEVVRPCADVAAFGSVFSRPGTHCQASTPVLALLSASLRARAALENSHG